MPSLEDSSNNTEGAGGGKVEGLDGFFSFLGLLLIFFFVEMAGREGALALGSVEASLDFTGKETVGDNCSAGEDANLETSENGGVGEGREETSIAGRRVFSLRKDRRRWRLRFTACLEKPLQATQI